ncbi:MAG: hypothetical protein RL017_170 [Pseudomonadota bacterium]|jgi:hypothetical protein
MKIATISNEKHDFSDTIYCGDDIFYAKKVFNALKIYQSSGGGFV